MYLKIQSQGEIDARAFTLMGGTTKSSDDNKTIGMYGSGLKYTISSLIRNKINFLIYSGTKELNFDVKSTKFRDTVFDVIWLNGKETNLTTNMGGNEWNDVFAPIREIYSNALDEDEDAVMVLTDVVDPIANTTTFYIDATAEIKDFYDKRHEYFLFKNPNVLFSNEAGSVYANSEQNTRFYRRGILCFKYTHEKAHYFYNSPHFAINESRVLADSWDAKNYVSTIWKGCNSYNEIKSLMDKLNGANTGSMEAELRWRNFGLCNAFFSKAWEDFVNDNKFVILEHRDLYESEELEGRYSIKTEMINELVKQFEDIDVLGTHKLADGEFYVEVKNAKESLINKVIDAYQSLLDTSYNDRIDNPNFRYVKFKNSRILGYAHKNNIYLSIKLIDSSISDIAKIIIEENEHNLSGYEDESRAFQNHLFNLYYNELIKNKDK